MGAGLHVSEEGKILSIFEKGWGCLTCGKEGLGNDKSEEWMIVIGWYIRILTSFIKLFVLYSSEAKTG